MNKKSGTKEPRKASSGSKGMPPKAKPAKGESCTSKSAARQF